MNHHITVSASAQENVWQDGTGNVCQTWNTFHSMCTLYAHSKFLPTAGTTSRGKCGGFSVKITNYYCWSCCGILPPTNWECFQLLPRKHMRQTFEKTILTFFVIKCVLNWWKVGEGMGLSPQRIKCLKYITATCVYHSDVFSESYERVHFLFCYLSYWLFPVYVIFPTLR